jgi:uncharacterized protein
VLVAFSAGVDSTFLLKVARDTLGRDNVLAVTGRSPSVPADDLEKVVQLAALIDVPHLFINTNELDDPAYAANPNDRCYHCKSELFDKLVSLAAERNIKIVLDGTNADDMGDHRPGARASAERNVKSPLRDCGYTKNEIRAESRRLNLPTWDKPEMACLASRIPYGITITAANLSMVDQGERVLRELGFSQLRVRHHGEMARLELLTEEIQKATRTPLCEEIDERLKAIGFKYVTVDLAGYRRGSMNR